MVSFALRNLKLSVAVLILITSGCTAADNISQGFADSDTVTANTPENFRMAKKILFQIHEEKQVTFYCGCRYRTELVRGKKKHLIDPDSCGYRSRKVNERADRVEWEHVVPAHNLGAHLPCWKEGHPVCSKPGRKCCEKTDPYFRKASADMHNLQPVIGELNNDRSNYRYDAWVSEADTSGFTQYGSCRFITDFNGDRVQPPSEIRGNIARTYFYMMQVYSVKIDDDYYRLLVRWNREDPPDEWEIRRNERISEYQGVGNPYIINFRPDLPE